MQQFYLQKTILSDDQKASWIEVECLGACVSAPMMQINDDFYEDLTEETTTKIFEGIKNDKLPKPGSQKGRVGFEPNISFNCLMSRQWLLLQKQKLTKTNGL